MSSTCPSRRRGRATILLIMFGISLSLASVPIEAHPEHWRYKRLIRKGVSIAVLAQTFRFRGLVKGGAPLVVDFRLASDGYLKLEIKTRNVRHRDTLEFPARAGVREIAVRALPADFFGDWQTGRLTVSAFDESGQEIDYRFFGIGVGERAVGSTAIHDVTFEPSEIRDMESARWGFRSKHDFERVGIVIYRWQTGAGRWRESQNLDAPCLPERGKRCEGNWDGDDQKGKRSTGMHLVAVKAWRSQDENDWIFEISEEEVAVK